MKPYLTTGEAAELLGISRSTVSRKFDQGVLKGKKNPITGERLVSRKSVEAFMKQYDLPLQALSGGKKIVVAGTSDEHLKNAIQQCLKGIESLEFEHVLFGTDALVQCSRRRADLLIIDNKLPDISGEEVIKAVRRRRENADLKIVYCNFDSEAAMLSDPEVYEVHVGEEINQTLLKEKILAALELSHHPETTERSPEFDRRVWPRIYVNIPAEIETYLVNRRETRQLGTAVVKNLSHGGRLSGSNKTGTRHDPGRAFPHDPASRRPTTQGLDCGLQGASTPIEWVVGRRPSVHEFVQKRSEKSGSTYFRF